MENKKKPHITMFWIVIAVLSINQAVGAYRCCESHRLLWDALIHQCKLTAEHLESTNQYLTKLNQILESAGTR